MPCARIIIKEEIKCYIYALLHKRLSLPVHIAVVVVLIVLPPFFIVSLVQDVRLRKNKPSQVKV